MDKYLGSVSPMFCKAILNAITGRASLDFGKMFLGINVDLTGPLVDSNGNVCNIIRPPVQGYEHTLVGVPDEPLMCKFGAPTYDPATGKTTITNKEEIHFKFNPNAWVESESEQLRPREWLLETGNGTIVAWGLICTSEYYGATNSPPANNIICIPKEHITISL